MKNTMINNRFEKKKRLTALNTGEGSKTVVFDKLMDASFVLQR